MFGISGRRRVSVAASLAMIVALSGCASQDVTAEVEDVVPSASPTTSAAAPVDSTPTSTPTSTPEPTATAGNPDDPDSWEIDFAGVGPLVLGGTLDEAAAAMPGFTRSFQEACPSVANFTADGFPDIWVGDPTGSGIIESVVVQKWGAPEAVASSSLRTEASIGIGSTLDDLTAAYPELSTTQGDYGPHYGVSNGERWINFAVTSGGLVDTIVVDTTSEMAPEYCG